MIPPIIMRYADMNENRYGGQKFALFIFECFMAVMYVLASYVFLFTHFFDNSILPKGIRIGLGIVLGLYGFFRIYRAYKKITQRNE